METDKKILIEKSRQFHRMHVKGSPLVLVNIWDAGSAWTVQSAGAKAIATGSWAVAAAHGYSDGEALPLQLVLQNLERVVANVDIPVTIDLERGYGQNAAEIKENVGKVIEKGAVGINLEDGMPGEKSLQSVQRQCQIYKAVREAAEEYGIPMFLNARSDGFFQASRQANDRSVLEEAIERAKAYEQAGADGLFVPGLQEEALIYELCQRSPLPVNVMTAPSGLAPVKLGELGVARVSYGPAPYLQAMEKLTQMVKACSARQLKDSKRGSTIGVDRAGWPPER